MLTEGSYEARIAGVVRRHLEARFGDWMAFDAVMVVRRSSQWGDDSLHVTWSMTGTANHWISAG